MNILLTNAYILLLLIELMTAIRRVKLSENSYVTPNEFRYTLIKFGVTLSQNIVDAVFNVFDR